MQQLFGNFVKSTKGTFLEQDRNSNLPSENTIVDNAYKHRKISDVQPEKEHTAPTCRAMVMTKEQIKMLRRLIQDEIECAGINGMEHGVWGWTEKELDKRWTEFQDSFHEDTDLIDNSSRVG